MTAPEQENEQDLDVTAPTDGVLTATATAADEGRRVDRFLTEACHGLSRSRIGALIRSGQVSGSRGTLVDADYRVKPGDTFRVVLPEPEPTELAGETIALSIAYEDKHLIVIDKPAGLVVHPAPGHSSGTLVNALIAHCGDSLSGIGGVRRPGIVHRLDKDTSGLMVVAKTDATHRALSEQFAVHGADGRLERAYQALVWGVPHRRTGTIAGAIGRSSSNRQKMAVVSETMGRHATTHYEVLETFAGVDGAAAVSLLKLVLETGRTHQIRVHTAHIGHPVLADPVYGTGFRTSSSRLNSAAQKALAQLGRQALHAAILGFEHPQTGKHLRFESPIPGDITAVIKALSKTTEKGRRGR